MTFVVVANLDDLEVGDTMLVDEIFREPMCLIRLNDQRRQGDPQHLHPPRRPLHEGSLQEDDTLVSPLHASRYNLTTGGAAACSPRPHPGLRVRVEDEVLVDIDQQVPNDAPLPRPPAPGSMGSR